MSIPADFGVILPAAGRGERFGGDKLSRRIAGRSVLEWSIRAFLDRSDVTVVAVMLAEANKPRPVSEAIAQHVKLRWCVGGNHRALSVLRGLEALGDLPDPPEFVAVHDAARPAVSDALIDRVFAAAREHGAAVPGLPVWDTIKRVGGGVVVETLPRGQLVAVQTPQAMRQAWLVEAFDRCATPFELLTDDAQLLELDGRTVRVVEAEPSNLKLTCPDDLKTLENVLRARHALG